MICLFQMDSIISCKNVPQLPHCIGLSIVNPCFILNWLMQKHTKKDLFIWGIKELMWFSRSHLRTIWVSPFVSWRRKAALNKAVDVSLLSALRLLKAAAMSIHDCWVKNTSSLSKLLITCTYSRWEHPTPDNSTQKAVWATHLIIVYVFHSQLTQRGTEILFIVMLFQVTSL